VGGAQPRWDAGDPGGAEPRQDTVSIPIIRLAFAASLLIHAALLWWPGFREVLSPSLENLQRGKPGGSLVVQLSSPPRAASAAGAPSASAAAAAPAPKSTVPDVAPQNNAGKSSRREPARPPAPTALARAAPPPDLRNTQRPLQPYMQQAPAAPAPPAAEPPAAASTEARPSATAPAASATDLASYIEARRRARGEASGSASESAGSAGTDTPDSARLTERERENQAVAARLGLRATATFGDDPKSGGGVFQIQRIAYDDADFVFYGWNKDIQRNSRQLIQTRKGDASDIRVAVVRRMIGIIRERESGEFIWISRRLGREVTLSAAREDNAGLEDFLMREFFGSGTATP